MNNETTTWFIANEFSSSGFAGGIKKKKKDLKVQVARKLHGEIMEIRRGPF